MSIKASKQRVTFVTEIETVDRLQEAVNLQRLNGRKITLSSYIDEILQAYLGNDIDRLFAPDSTFPTS